jgi:hypothetical protein
MRRRELIGDWERGGAAGRGAGAAADDDWFLVDESTDDDFNNLTVPFSRDRLY